MPLGADETATALRRIAACRVDVASAGPAGAKPVTCPRCDAPGLAIEDRSARPHAEWYFLRCQGCGLDETIHIAHASPTWGGD